ncbi:hypothetical protein [Brachyspira pilosicoli]|uniref:Lipoprotein n=1 Tax=Brachyspira pilosicoli TaxID=52584 RepID=A0A5C8EYX6_BRAPL|nr:hypothetical protein [Brachyspira pilosicoli]TXJ42131.1 hypothetical protein EPJ72_05830 [Brachyspira pilosicoli]
MNKKLLSILFILFFAFAVSCQNADKTGSVDSSKGIEQFNGNTYISDAIDNGSGINIYYFVLIKNSKVASYENSTQDTPNVPDEAYLEVEGTGTDYTLKDPASPEQKIKLKFSSDGNTVTVNVDVYTIKLNKK